MKIFHPENRLRIGWDILLTFTILASSVIFPYRVLSGQNPFDGLYWFITLIFMLDILVAFNTAFRRGLETVTDRKVIAANYLRTRFMPDFFAAIPFPLIAVMIGGKGHAAEIIALVLLALRLLKLVKMKDIFKSLQEVLDINPGLMRLVVFAFWFALITHFMAVGWLAIGAGSKDGTFGLRYLQALYWCVTTIATIGYGDITPDRTVPIQLVYTIIVQLFGVSMYGFIIGNISSLIANLDVNLAAYKRKMEEVRDYMKSRNLPAELQKKVKEYYAYIWETRRSSSGSEGVLSELPHTLSTDISMFINRNILTKVAMFRDSDELFLREVVRELATVVFLPEDFIIRQGEHADCMYFVSSGEVEIIIGEKTVAKLGAGSPFGEAALLEGGLRTASVKALTYCETYRLLRSDFDNLRHKYEDFDHKVRQIMADRAAQTKK